MSVVDIWKSNKEEFNKKSIDQVQGFIGQLLDESAASEEFRTFIMAIPSQLLKRYATECLEKSFKDSGLVLQDIVNEIGRRLGYKVAFGRYRGTQKHEGHDGLWQTSSDESIVVEIKTTTTYLIDLETIAQYRAELISQGKIERDSSSILIVVGRIDTEGLEAQTRGSRHAWDTRLISVLALIKLLEIKESIDDPNVFERIRTLLRPSEYTLLDNIVDLVFSTTEEAKSEEEFTEATLPEPQRKAKPKRFTPVNFYEDCIGKLEKKLGTDLIKESKGRYSTPNLDSVIQLSISKKHSATEERYWFAFHPYQKERLLEADKGYVSWGCGSGELVFMVPITDLEKWLPKFWTTERQGKMYWHIVIRHQENGWVLKTNKDEENINIDGYRI